MILHLRRHDFRHPRDRKLRELENYREKISFPIFLSDGATWFQRGFRFSFM